MFFPIYVYVLLQHNLKTQQKVGMYTGWWIRANFQSFKASDYSCGERGSNTWPSDLQSDALRTELSLQYGDDWRDIRIEYIATLCRGYELYSSLEYNS